MKLCGAREEYAGLIMTLAKQERADTSGYDDPEVVFRSPERYHAGLIVRSKDHTRANKLVTSYVERFQSDFMAMLPAASHPAH